jgi:ABC-2 type transport system permease protein
MTRLQVVRLVAVREIRERIRSSAFLASTALSLVVVLALAIVPALLRDDGPATYDVGVAGAAALPDRLTAVAAAEDDVELDLRPVGDAAEAERLLADGDLDAAVVDGEVLVHEELGDRLGGILQEAHRQVVTEAALADVGLSPAEAGPVLDPPPLAVRAVDPPDEEQQEHETLVLIGTMLLYGQLLGFGFYVASGVVEEKSSRVVELLLAKAGSTPLLTGKIIGIGVIGFLQLIGFVVVGLVAASMSGVVALPPDTIWAAVQVVGWFVLGFALYSCLYAVGGALASKPEEMQNTTMPLTLLSFGAFFAAINAGGSPDGTIARIATFLPPSAPVVLPIRSAAGAIPLWEVLVSVAIVLASIVLVVRLAARVYAGGALQTRSQIKLRQALAGGR